MIRAALRRLIGSRSGAVRLDWPVLAAVAVAMGTATLLVAARGDEGRSAVTAAELASADPRGLILGGTGPGGWGSYPLLNTSLVTVEDYAIWTSGYSDRDLVEIYVAYQNGAHHTMLDPGDRIDSLGALEAEMARRGIARPEGYPTYAEHYADHAG